MSDTLRRIELRRLTLKNFKGIRDLTADFGPSTTVSGANGTGKTTLFDAFTWCLFGKDSAGRTDSGRGSFTVKTVDSAGGTIEKLEHTVTALLAVDGKPVELSRSLREKWVKPRGKTETEMQGNETRYYVDGVEIKAAQFTERVDAICSEDLFRMITNPEFFPSLGWEAQRQVLVTMAGGVTYRDVAQGIEELTAFLDRLSGKDLAQYRQEVAFRKKSIRTELEECPVKIDAIVSVTPEAPDYKALEFEQAQACGALEEAESQIEDVAKANRRRFEAQRKTQGQINDLEARQQKVLFEARQEAGQRKYRANERRGEIRSALDSARREFTNFVTSYTMEEEKLCGRLADSNARTEALLKERESKLEEWTARNAEEYEGKDTALVCPIYRTLCSDASVLKTDSEAKAKARDAFMARKNSDLDRITEEGKRIVDRIEMSRKDTAALSVEIKKFKDDSDARKKEIQDRIAALQTEYENTPEIEVDTNIDPATLPEWVKLEEERKGLAAALESEKKDGSDDTAVKELTKARASIQERLRAVNEKLSVRKTIEKNEAKIAEIKARERELAQQLADLEREEATADVLEKARINEVESRVNGLFRIVRFRMFERQLNGGEAPTCVAMVDGVKYSDLNTAGRINAGLDIINALCGYHGVSAPVFIDNAERVNDIFPITSQIIKLRVSRETELTFTNN